MEEDDKKFTFEVLNIEDLKPLTTDQILTIDNLDLSFPNNIITYHTASLDTTWMNEWTKEVRETEELRKIITASKNNEALQKAIERVKMIYYMTQNGEQEE